MASLRKALEDAFDTVTGKRNGFDTTRWPKTSSRVNAPTRVIGGGKEARRLNRKLRERRGVGEFVSKGAAGKKPRF